MQLINWEPRRDPEQLMHYEHFYCISWTSHKYMRVPAAREEIKEDKLTKNYARLLDEGQVPVVSVARRHVGKVLVARALGINFINCLSNGRGCQWSREGLRTTRQSSLHTKL